MKPTALIVLLAVTACFMLVEAQKAANTPTCGNGPCRGPIEIQYAGFGCQGAPTAYIQLLPDTLALSKQGRCVDDNSTWLTSSAWMCDPGHNFADSQASHGPLFEDYDRLHSAKTQKRNAEWKTRGVYRLLNWKSLGCVDHAPITKERPVGQCFNGNGYSFAFSCDTTPMKWVPSDSFGFQTSGPSIGKPNVPCPENKCPSKVPYVSYHKTADCSDDSVNAPVKAPTAMYANSELDTCYTRYNETTTSFAYTINMWCDVQGQDSTLQIDLRTVGCSPDALPFQTLMYDERIAGRTECFPDKSTGLYFRYHCLDL